MRPGPSFSVLQNSIFLLSINNGYHFSLTLREMPILKQFLGLFFYRGENAFFSMQFQYGWSQRPMLPRIISELSPSVPVSFIYGARSWMDSSAGERIREARSTSYVNIHFIKKAGHHVHAEQPEQFNTTVNHILSVVDSGSDSGPVIADQPRSRTNSYHEESG